MGFQTEKTVAATPIQPDHSGLQAADPYAPTGKTYAPPVKGPAPHPDSAGLQIASSEYQYPPQYAPAQYGSQFPHGAYAPVPPNAMGEPVQKKPRKKRWWIIAVVVLILLAAGVGGGVAGALSSKNKSSSPSTSSTPTSSPSATPSTYTAGPLTPLDDTSLSLASYSISGSSSSGSSPPTLQLFYQSQSGGLVSALLDPSTGKWSYTPISIPGSQTPPKNNTPLAQLNWAPSAGSTAREVRLYYLNGANIMCDLSYSGGKWSAGNLSSAAWATHPQSKLATTTWNNNGEQWVYYQTPDLAVQEIGYSPTSGRWGKSNASPVLSLLQPGSFLATSYFIKGGSDQQLRLYGQDDEGSLMGRYYENAAWAKVPVTIKKYYSGLVKPAPFGVATTLDDKGDAVKIRLVYQSGDKGSLSEIVVDGGTVKENNDIVKEGELEKGGLSVVAWGDSAKVFYQKDGEKFAVEEYDGKNWKGVTEYEVPS